MKTINYTYSSKVPPKTNLRSLGDSIMLDHVVRDTGVAGDGGAGGMNGVIPG